MKSPSAFPQQRRSLISIAVALAVAQYGAALAAPTGHQIVTGTVTVTRPNALQTVISQASQSAIVNWQQFSIGASEHVDIRQPNVSSVLLNRAIGNKPSEIYGRLSANGQVFLVNSNGVLFGRNAQVSVGGLVASTLDIANDDFLAGRYHFSGAGNAAVENQGSLTAAERGTVALLGGRVNNDGTISAQLGTAALAAGEKISLDFEGDGLTKIRVDQGAVAALVANRGMIIADGGQAVMSAGAAQALADTVLNQQGVVRARSLLERDGKIVLDGGTHGVSLNSGTLDATGGAALKGGVVNVLGHHVGLTGTASIDASGEAGGGSIFVGGGVQGGNPLLRHAAATFAGPQVSLRADALGQGNGGTVVLWSDGSTRMFGAASAAGGPRAGDGGFIETSGKFLDVASARIDASARVHGKAGVWLLDPYDINIVGTPPETSVQSSPNFVSDGTSSELWNQTIVTALDQGTNVTVTTGAGGSQEVGSITVLADIEKNTGGAASLTLNAADAIYLMEGVQVRSNAGALDVNLNANAAGSGNGGIYMGGGSAIVSNGGNVHLYGQSNLAAGFAESAFESGIVFEGGTIDTRSALAGGGDGNIVLRGRASGTSTGSAGVTLMDSILTTGSGSISITGIGGAGHAGVALYSPVISTTGGGSIDLRGQAVSDSFGEYSTAGITADDAVIYTSGGPGSIMLSGEAVGSSGISLGSSTLGTSDTTGDITLRAFNTPSGMFTSSMLSMQGPVTTTGVLALRPGGVSAAGALTAKDDVAIDLYNEVSLPGAFGVSEYTLGELVSSNVAAVVLGSSTHTGAITAASFSGLGSGFDLTLQNGGAGSSGIVIDGMDLTGRVLTLSSGGSVTQTGTLIADGLLLHGTQAASNFSLNDNANTVNTLSAIFDQPKGSGATDGDVSYFNAINLALGPLSGFGADNKSNLVQAIDASASSVSGDMTVMGAGTVSVFQPVSMTGTSATLDLSAGSALNVVGPITASANNATVNLLAATNASLGGAIDMHGSQAFLNINATDLVNLSGTINMLGAQGVASANAGGDLNADATIAMNGDGARLNLFSGGGNIAFSGTANVTGASAGVDFTASNTLSMGGDITMSGARGALRIRADNAISLPGSVVMSGADTWFDMDSQGSLTVSGDISAGGVTVSKLQANGDISLAPGASITANAVAGPLQLQINSDADSINGGGVFMNTSSIVTSGGNLLVYGQSDITTGFASGSSFLGPDGITLQGAGIDTGAGTLTMRGRGTTFAGSGTIPSAIGDGILINASSVNSTSGAMGLMGMGGQGGTGLVVQNSTLASTAGGTIDLRGRSGDVITATGAAGGGLFSSDSSIASAGPGQVWLSGESAGGVGVALSGTNTVGSAASTGNVVVRAFSTGQTAASPAMLSVGGALQTAGVINIRPGGVSASGALTEQPGTVINLGGASSPGQFLLSQAALDAAVRAGSSAVVIGGAAQTGAINVTSSGPASGLYDLTLQNDSAGSGGINLIGGLSIPGRMLTLSSGGSVTQAGPVVAGRLLLRGTQPQANFQLAHAGNAVDLVSATFLQPKGSGIQDGDVNFYTSGDLVLGAMTGVGFDGVTSQAQSFISAANTAIAGDLTLGAGIDLNLAGNISMSAGGSTLNLSAGRSIRLDPGVAIGLAAPVGTLQVNFNADADGVGGGAIGIGSLASIATNGGNVTLYGQSDAVAGFASGTATMVDGIALDGAINSGAGSVTVRGRGFAGGSGVSLAGASVTSTSAPMTVTGIGGAGATGVRMTASQVNTTAGGAIDIRGRSGADTATAQGAGILMNTSTVRTAGGAGEMSISGQAFGGSGVALIGTNTLGGSASTGNIVLRAANASTVRTLDSAATVQTSGVVNIRPGSVSSTGQLSEAPDTVINIGGVAKAGEFSMTQDVLVSGIQGGTPAVIVGSAAQTGAINVLANAPLGGSYFLTLQNGAGSGGINLYNGLSIPGRMLTLSSGGSVNQGAAIVAGRLLLHGTQPQSSFQLTNTGNAVSRVSTRFDVLKGTAPTNGDVNFFSAGNLEIGPMSGLGFDGATGQPQSFAATNAVIAGDVVAQAGGNLTLLQNVSTLGSDITLAAGGVLLNPANATLMPGGGGRWRVFANTWVGEVDGGITGTAPAPNYYNCLFGAACANLLPATNNYFVYRQQPVIDVVLTTPNQTRVYGTANPAFPFTATGLINGDALAVSLVGAYAVPTAVNVSSYAVPGAFTSPVGYLVNAVPGTLNVTPATLTYVATPASRASGQVNPPLTGTVTGLVNGDTLAGATTGTLSFSSPAPLFAAAGQYPVNAGGLTASNYVFQHAPGNLTALTVSGVVQSMPSISNEVSMPSSDLYGANFGLQRACVGSGPLAGPSGAGDANDSLAMEWSRVRETPNLSNCVGLAQRYRCGDF